MCVCACDIVKGLLQVITESPWGASETALQRVFEASAGPQGPGVISAIHSSDPHSRC